MCIVIDTNAFGMVFNEDNERHEDFSHVKKWIDKGDGFVVYGGSKYKKELVTAGRYMKLLKLLRDGGMAIAISDQAVDDLENLITEKTSNTDCDDQHIVALLGASKCSLLCSADSRSFPFIKDKNLYPKGSPAVRIYTSSRNKDLLIKTTVQSLKNRAAM